MKDVKIGNRIIGDHFPPFVIAEIGINHSGNVDKALQMIEDAYLAGCECVKFQCHIPEVEMIKEASVKIIPVNAKESIYDIIKKCSFTEEQEMILKKETENRNMIYLSTPFSREAVDRLERLNICAYKIGSGECNNYPLVEYIAQKKKPIILSTGMNNIHSIKKSVNIIKKYGAPFILLHCTSLYPTPYEDVRLSVLEKLQKKFKVIVGLSDHSIGNYTSFGAVALGALVLEKHFTSDSSWEGPDIEISIDPKELKDLIIGAKAIHASLGDSAEVDLEKEKITAKFAYASVCSIRKISAGEVFSLENIWAKRPGTGEISVIDFDKILGKKAKNDIPSDVFLKYEDI